MIKLGLKLKPKNIPRDSKKSPRKFPGPKSTPRKSHAEFLALKISRED